VQTDVPARLDRLPWGRFHTLVVIALGITWILDGLEVTLAGAVSPALKESPRLHFSNADVGFASSAYLGGAVLGALLFGWLTDRLGRKRLFFVTVAVYLVATAARITPYHIVETPSCASQQFGAPHFRNGSKRESALFGLMSASTSCGHTAALTFAAVCQQPT
jgi:MFS family permease